jgi:hypothetical protein
MICILVTDGFLTIHKNNLVFWVVRKDLVKIGIFHYIMAGLFTRYVDT